jgi:putative membrane protein
MPLVKRHFRRQFPVTRFHLVLLAFFAGAWLWAAIDPVHPRDWLLENLLVFGFVPLILYAVRRFRLSNLSCTLLTIFMVMHVIGSHYTYAEVPLGDAMQRWFGADRNLYDRLVHFCFGLLVTYPMREVLLQATRATGRWALALPLASALSFSAVYEIIEWRVAERVDPEAGLAFLGAQGDVWDAQKDMLLAGLGALLAMALTAAARHWFGGGARRGREPT